MDKRYNEFKVTIKHENVRNSIGEIIGTKPMFKDGFPVIDKKEPTERGHVMISDRDADTNNRQTRFNFLHYELAEDVKSPERIALEEEAIELGVQFRANIGDEKLLAKITEAKEK